MMEAFELSPRRREQLETYARRHGQEPAAALDNALATFFESEERIFEESVKAIEAGLEDIQAGRTTPAKEFFSEMRLKYGIPG